MIAYLKGNELKRPTTVTAATPASDTAKSGRVTSTIKHGEIFLHAKGDSTDVYRLRWAPGDEERARTVPAGAYRVSGYRHVATAKDGVQWVWSTTSPGYADIEVKAGETTAFAVRQAIDVKVRAVERRGKRRVALVFQAEKRLGNTLYRAGKRITIRWECLDADGEPVAAGAMRYG